MNLLKELLLDLIPHYVTDRVALYLAEDETLQVLCLESQLRSDDDFVCLGTAKTFTWLGVRTGCRVIIDKELKQ